MNMFRILWPEERLVSEDTIKMWFEDAVDNGDVSLAGASSVEDFCVSDMALSLRDAGLITLAKL